MKVKTQINVNNDTRKITHTFSHSSFDITFV